MNIEEIKNRVNITKNAFHTKEIEDLKLKIGDEKVFIQLGECIGEKKAKDKIKAKMEEIDKILERNLLVDSLRDYFETQKEVLESLLEKE